MKYLFFFLIFVLLSVSIGNAQSLIEIDNKLVAYLNKITYWDEYDYKDNTVSKEDSLDKTNADLSNYLKKICSQNPATIRATFSNAQKMRLTIVSSNDNKLRLYSWDSRMGGTMRYYEDLAQYQSNNGLMVCDMKDTTMEGDYGGDYRSVVTIHTKEGKTVYMVQDYSIVSTKDRAESITAYTIEGESLKKISIFRTKNQSLNTIGYGYDVFTSSDKFPKSDIPTIHFSKDKQKLYIPIVSGPYNEDVTNKNLVYVFDGNNYVFDKNTK